MANIMNCAGGGTAAAGTGSGNLPYTPAKLEILDNFISKLTPKPRETDRGPPLTDRIETRPLPTATWTALPDPDVGITAIVEGAEAVLVASQKLHFLIQRELHLELFCDSEIYSITYQKCREGQIPAWVIGGTGVLATNGVSNNPRADPLDEFIDKLTPSDEQDEDEVEQRIDTSTIENHPPIILLDRIKERMGKSATQIIMKAGPILGDRLPQGPPHHLTFWISRSDARSRGHRSWVQFDNGPRQYLDDEDESHQEA